MGCVSFFPGKLHITVGSTSSRSWKCPALGDGTSRVPHRWSLIKQFSHCHTRREAEAGRESHPGRQHVAAVCQRLSTGYPTCPTPFSQVNLPVERTGRFCTLIPKLFLGSSFSSDGSSWDAGAGTAVDCTERAGDSSLELLLESLLGVAQREGQVSAQGKVTQEMVILLKKQNFRVSAHLQVFLPLVPVVSVLSPAIHTDLSVFLSVSPTKAPRRDRQGSGMWVKCQWDPVTHPDNGGDLIKRNAMLDQLRRCVGRVEKYREDAQVWQCLKTPPSTLMYRKEILLCSQASSLKRSVNQRDHVWKSWQEFWSTAWEQPGWVGMSMSLSQPWPRVERDDLWDPFQLKPL